MTKAPIGRLASRRLALLIGLNVVLLVLWTWAQLETQTIAVEVTRQEVRAYVDDRFIVSTRSPFSDGDVGLYLGDGGYVQDDPKLPEEVRNIALRLRESAWGRVVVRSLDGEILTTAERRVGLLGLLPLTGAAERSASVVTPNRDEYVVEATLLRPREPAGVIVQSIADEGVLFFFRPEHRDTGLWIGSTNGPAVLLRGGPYRLYQKTIPAALQDVTRLLLSAYPLALAVVGGVFAARLFGRRLGRRSAQSASVPLERVRPARVSSCLTWGAVGVLAIATLALTGYVADAILERMPHVQDSVAYLFQAKVFARGQIWAPLPNLPEFFEHEFVVMRDGRWFAKYPPGFPAVLALGVLAGAPWLVNPISAALSIVLIFLIGRRVGGPAAGLIGAGLAVTSPFFVFMSGSFMAHPVGLLLVLTFTWLFLRRERLPSALGAGAALGLAMLVRPWTMAAIAVPFAVMAAADLVTLKSRAVRRYVFMGVGFLPFLAVWFAYNAILTGSPLSNTMELWWAFDRVGFGADHGPFGFWPADGFANTSRNLSLLLSHLFGWPPIATLFFATLPFVSGRARRVDALLLAGFLSLVVGYFAWWADGVMYGPRFLYESIGFLFVLTGRGVVELAALARRALGHLGVGARWPGSLIAGLLIVCLVSLNGVLYIPAQLQLHRGYNYVNRSSLDAVEAAGLHNALVFADAGGQYEWWWYGMVFSANSPFLDSDVLFARDLGAEANAKLIAEFPDRRPYRLSRTTLVPLARPD